MSGPYAGQRFLAVQKSCTGVLHAETGLLFKPSLQGGFCCKIKAGLDTVGLTLLGCWLAMPCGVVCSPAGLRVICGIGVIFVCCLPWSSGTGIMQAGQKEDLFYVLWMVMLEFRWRKKYVAV